MTSATCPHCQDQVTVPAGADPDATVRCPLCQEEFELSVVLEALPPQLIVVGGGTSTEEGRAADGGPSFLSAGIDADDSTGSDFRFADEGQEAGSDESSAFRFGDEGDDDAGSTKSGGSAAKGVSSVRTKKSKPKKSAAMEMVKIFLGGIVGLTIGYVLLWWILAAMGRRPQDPVGVAPMVSRFVPWIVPQQLRGSSSSEQGSSGGGFDDSAANASLTSQSGGGPRAIDSNRRRQDRQQAGRNLNGGGLAAAGGGGLGGASPFGTGEGPNAIDNGNMLDGGGGLGAESSGGGGVDIPEIDVPDIGVPDIGVPDIGAPSIDPQVGDTAVGDTAGGDTAGGDTAGGVTAGEGPLVSNAPDISASQYQDRLDTAQAKDKVWQKAEGDEKSRVAVNLYIALSLLGEAMTFADRADPEVQSSVGDSAKWLTQLAADPPKCQALGTLGAKWLKSANRTNRGVLLTGAVKSVEKQGNFYAVRLSLSETAEPTDVTVILLGKPGPQVKEGLPLLVAGAITTDPATNLKGYQGDEDLVVLGGHLEPLQ